MSNVVTVSPLAKQLLLEAIELADTVANSRTGAPTDQQYKRARIIFPHMLVKLPNGKRSLVNRNKVPIGIDNAWAGNEHPEMEMDESPVILSVLENGALFNDDSAPWLSRARMKQYSRRLRLLAAACGLEVE